MVKNIWSNIEFTCIHNHPQPIPMEVIENGQSPFYACPHYFKEKRQEDEKMCYNRVSLYDVEGIVDKFGKIIEDTDKFGGTDFTGFEFDYKMIHVRVVKYSPHHVIFGVENKKVFQ